MGLGLSSKRTERHTETATNERWMSLLAWHCRLQAREPYEVQLLAYARRLVRRRLPSPESAQSTVAKTGKVAKCRSPHVTRGTNGSLCFNFLQSFLTGHQCCELDSALIKQAVIALCVAAASVDTQNSQSLTLVHDSAAFSSGFVQSPRLTY